MTIFFRKTETKRKLFEYGHKNNLNIQIKPNVVEKLFNIIQELISIYCFIISKHFMIVYPVGIVDKIISVISNLFS